MIRRQEFLNHSRATSRKHHLFCIAALLAIPLFPAPQAVELRFQNFTVKDGLWTDNVNCLFADRRGFLWIGTYWGLDRYDGYSFQHYTHHPRNTHSLSQDTINWMHDDRLGRLWVANRASLDILDPHTGRVTRLLQPTKEWGAEISVFDECRGSEMWIGTMTGKIIILDSANGQALPIPLPLRPAICPGKPISRILESPAGDIWISSGCGLARYSPGADRIVRYGFGERPTDTIGANVHDICLDEQGFVWVATDTGLNRLDPSLGTFRHFPLPKDSAPIRYGVVHSDPAGYIWLGCREGVKLFDRQSGQFVDSLHFRSEPVCFKPHSVIAVCADRAGNIWAGTFGKGLCRFNPRVNQFRYIDDIPDPEYGVSDPWVDTLLEDRDGNVWIGTRRSGLIRYDPVSGTSRRAADPLSDAGRRSPLSKRILAQCEDSDGTIWIGTGDGLFRHEPRSGDVRRFAFSPAGPLEPWPPRIIAFMQAEEPNALWICTLSHGIYRVDRHTHAYKEMPLAEVLPAGLYPRALEWLFVDRYHSLWIGTENGLLRMSRGSGRFERLLPGKSVWSTFEDHNGNFWAAASQGLILLDRLHGTFRLFNRKDGLDCDRTYVVNEDEDGYIWIGSNRGLSRLDPRTEVFLNFETGDGVTCDSVNNLLRCRDGRMVASGINGVLLFDPRAVVRKNAHVPPVLITSLRVDKRNLPLSEVFPRSDQAVQPGRLVLGPRDRVLAVEFAALDFSAPERNRYMFRMEEQGDEWNDLGNNRRLTFSSLGAGEHFLRIKGSNNDGVWNGNGVALRIVVLPHFWQTGWFKLLALLALAAAALAITRVCRTISSLKRIARPPNLEEIFSRHNISRREQEILNLVIQGKSNRDMEKELFISVPTVKRHLANIYGKVGVSSRLQLINFLQGRRPRY